MIPFYWIPYEEPQVFEPLWFENFDVIKSQKWMEDFGYVSYFIVAIYIFTIFFLRNYMISRPAFDLRNAWLAWNIITLVLSVFSSWRGSQELLYVLGKTNGFFKSVCTRAGHSQPHAFWLWTINVFKFPQLLDTFFIVLRKRPLQFMHYYHHSVALIYSWNLYPVYDPVLRWLVTLNSFVHVVFYSYLILKSLELPCPKAFSTALIAIEIAQMSFAIILTIYAFWAKATGLNCIVSDKIFNFSIVIYGSVLLLITADKLRGKAGSKATLKPKKT